MRRLLLIPAILVALGLALGEYFTRKAMRDPNQARFLAASLPDPLPDGAYDGSAPGYDGPWKGKTFHSATASGINRMVEKSGPRERFPFRTYVGKGVLDPATEVLKIDYALRSNAPWLWPVLDEIVQIGPGHYLGKAHLRLIPGHPFTVTFFELKQTGRRNRVDTVRMQAVVV